MKNLRIAFLLCLIIFLFGCHKQVACIPNSKISSLKLLVAAHAASDAKQAFSSGDHRLLGFTGMGFEAPGFSGDPFSYSGGIKMIDGTSDVTCNKDDWRLNQNAWLYAKQYNQEMISLTNVK